MRRTRLLGGAESSWWSRVGLPRAICCTAFVTCGLVAAGLTANEPSGWAQWRGPLGTGASPDADPPIRWSETENVRFKVEIPGNSLSSPVVWGDRIFLMSAVSLDEEAFDRAKAKAQEVVDAGKWPPDVAPVKQRFIVQARSRLDGSLIWEREPLSRLRLGGGLADRRR